MSRSASDNSEGLTFTGADIWVPRGPISRNEQFGIPTGYCSAVLRETTGTVSNGGGRSRPVPKSFSSFLRGVLSQRIKDTEPEPHYFEYLKAT